MDDVPAAPLPAELRARQYLLSTILHAIAFVEDARRCEMLSDAGLSCIAAAKDMLEGAWQTEAAKTKPLLPANWHTVTTMHVRIEHSRRPAVYENTGEELYDLPPRTIERQIRSDLRPIGEGPS